MTNLYPPVKQFETIRLEAEQLAQLRRERGELRSPERGRVRRTWRSATHTLAMHLFRNARRQHDADQSAPARSGGA